MSHIGCWRETSILVFAVLERTRLWHRLEHYPPLLTCYRGAHHCFGSALPVKAHADFGASTSKGFFPTHSLDVASLPTHISNAQPLARRPENRPWLVLFADRDEAKEDDWSDHKIRTVSFLFLSLVNRKLKLCLPSYRMLSGGCWVSLFQAIQCHSQQISSPHLPLPPLFLPLLWGDTLPLLRHTVSKLRAQGVERERKLFWCVWAGQEVLVKQNLTNLLKGVVAGRGRLSASVVSNCVISHVSTKYSPDLTRDLLHSPWLEPLWCHTDTNLPWGSSCSGLYLSLPLPKGWFCSPGGIRSPDTLAPVTRATMTSEHWKLPWVQKSPFFPHELLLCHWLSTILQKHFHCAQRRGGKWETSLVNRWKRHIPDLTAAPRICCCFLVYSITQVYKGCPQTGGFIYM